MAQIESILGDQSDSPQDKKNNVTELSSQQNKGGSATRNTTSSAGSTPGSFEGGGSQNIGTTQDFGTGASTSAGSGGGAATATARSFIDQAKETAGQAYEAVTDKAATTLDERKSTLTQGLSTVADSVRQVSANLGSSQTDSGLAEAAARYTDTAARKLENVAGYFETRNVREMARDLEGFARRNPALFLGAAFGLGILAARFFKSTNPSYDTTAAAGRDFSSAATSESNPGGTPGF